jgi:predicted house-cleaning noncanonical NTP pyrophosphatase (MazG superfamily)
MRVEHHKLVRDRIPEIIKLRGARPFIRVLDSDEYRSALIHKLLEEAQEAQLAHPNALPYELADLLEVIDALLSTLNLPWDDFRGLAAAKRLDRGGFHQRLFLEYVEEVK